MRRVCAAPHCGPLRPYSSKSSTVFGLACAAAVGVSIVSGPLPSPVSDCLPVSMLSEGRRDLGPPPITAGDCAASVVADVRRPGVIPGSPVWVSDGLPGSLGTPPRAAFSGRGARLPCAQGRRPPLLDGPGVAADGREIGRHGGGFPRASGIMFPKKPCIGLLEFARAAVAGIAGAGENLAADLPASRLDWACAGRAATESAAATNHTEI